MSVDFASPMATHASASAASVQDGSAGRIVASWGSVALLCLAVAYVGASLLLPDRPGFDAWVSGGWRPLELFVIGLAPMVGAALVVWMSREALSPAERRSRLVGAAMSAVLFVPALLLARVFG